MRVLVLNAGSSSVKVAIAEVAGGRARVVIRRTVGEQGGGGAAALFERAIASVAREAGEIAAVGHRVVHGGTRFRGPVKIDADVEAGIASLAPLAPLHNPLALEGIRVARARFPELPMVAVFDTDFHRQRPLESRRYALPDDLTEELGLWRYGFHGIAHASLVGGVAALEQTTAERITAVTLQLGRGCSACAVLRGASIETSMGFTPLEGLAMGTRSGDVDPGLVLYLLRQGRSLDEVEELLEKRSGLLGVGGSADMRELLRAEAGGDRRAALAIAIFIRRIVATVGAYFTLLEGEGRLVFGGGIGENAPAIRERVAAGLKAWGVRLDLDRNAANEPGRISTADSRAVYVVRSDEETIIACAAEKLLA